MAPDPYFAVMNNYVLQAGQKGFRYKGAQFSLFVVVARVRKTSTITKDEHDCP
jgi:hypothetical protein